jgi:hypothetical protein
VIISRKPAGGGTTLEPLNLIGRKWKESFLSDGTSKTYQLTAEKLDADAVTVRIMTKEGEWEDKKEGTDFTVDREKGTVTFMTAPGNSPVQSFDNVEITAAKTREGYADKINKCRIMTLYAKEKGETLLDVTDPTYGAFIAFWFGTEEWAKDGVSAYFLNSYAMAGFVSANVFCQGLSRMSGQVLSWEGFIDAMESAPVNVPMGTNVNYANGQRVGIDALAVNKYTLTNLGAGEVYRGITDLATLEAAVK